MSIKANKVIHDVNQSQQLLESIQSKTNHVGQIEYSINMVQQNHKNLQSTVFKDYS